MLNPTKPPKKKGYRFEYREGCRCEMCPWKGNCRGEDWPHWYGTKISINQQIKEP